MSTSARCTGTRSSAHTHTHTHKQRSVASALVFSLFFSVLLFSGVQSSDHMVFLSGTGSRHLSLSHAPMRGTHTHTHVYVRVWEGGRGRGRGRGAHECRISASFSTAPVTGLMPSTRRVTTERGKGERRRREREMHVAKKKRNVRASLPDHLPHQHAHAHTYTYT